jgi:hypothetical protein
MMSKSKTIIVAVMILMLYGMTAYPVMAASERVYTDSASFGSSGYAVDETVTINAKIKWADLTANRTISVQLWNATDVVETLESYTVPYNASDTLTPDGSVTKTYTPSADLTEEVGTYTYYVKLFSSGLQVDTDPITLVVADSQLTMSITWQDQNNDRVVEPNELVTFTGYINWAFVENTEAHSLYVNYGDGEQLLSSVAVTAGSGSQTVTDSHGFNAAGAKSAVFTLKDATGTAVKSSTVAILVGSQPVTTTSPPVQTTSIVGLMAANWAVLAIVAAGIIVGYVYLGDQPKKRK